MNEGTGANNQIYNNTIFYLQAGAPPNPYFDFAIAATSVENARIYNNLSDKDFAGADLRNSLVSADPGFVDAVNGNFQLLPGSPAIDYGTDIPGITDGYVGRAPDVGAYEQGLPAWTAGANLDSVSP